ncbi:J domain-containing protein [Azohydromonas caseinilytica]|uniref:J domain-containing protein n=1 Tax=Azohydromonas caseinilytica TaxID=2728836 RepID=A0A848F8C1_9BURK|nr:J domain-containing protein [Azohydromonas caseinilytica]NML15016.1 J domain-containing protein [Azohydromonas caseinilytica]
MSRTSALQVAASPDGPALTPQQKRFNNLIRQIEQARQTLAAWPEAIAAYRHSHAQVVQPLLDELDAADRQRAFALDERLDRPGWTKTERDTLAALVRETVRRLLDGGDADPALKALYDKHSDIDFDTEQQEMALALKNAAEALTGLDLGDDEGIHTEADVFERVQRGFSEQAPDEEAEDFREAQPEPEPETPSARRRRAAQRKREAQAEAQARQATQSLREVFRKLASALHPDRETDPAQRAAKTALMQQANQAYQSGDLLTLLELQLQVEQIDAGHIAQADPQRLKHYNKVLAEQLSEINGECARVESAFRFEFGLEPRFGTDPQRLGKILETQARALRAELEQMALELRMLEDKALAKRWLRHERQRLRDEDFGFGFF